MQTVWYLKGFEEELGRVAETVPGITNTDRHHAQKNEKVQVGGGP